MKTVIYILMSLSALFGVGYIFFKPSFKVISIDGNTQRITFTFDGIEYTYDSGLGKSFTTTSRGYILEIKDDVLSTFGVPLSGKIVATVTQWDSVVNTYKISPIEQGFFLWRWKKII